jgi:hypothetical protein
MEAVKPKLALTFMADKITIHRHVDFRHVGKTGGKA